MPPAGAPPNGAARLCAVTPLTIMSAVSFSGLDLLTTAVVVLDDDLSVVYLNPAAETVFALSQRNVAGQPFADLFVDGQTFGQKLSQCAG